MTEDPGKYDVDAGEPTVTLIGVVETIKKVPSRQVTQVIIELPTEHFKPAVQYFDAEMVMVTVASKELRELPYGVHKAIVLPAQDQTMPDLDASPYEPEDDEPFPVDDEDEPFPVDREEPEPAKPAGKSSGSRVGPHCWEAIQFCQEPLFQEFMFELKGAADITEPECKEELCNRCNIDSRKELDTDPVAHKSAQQIYRQYNDWLNEDS